MVTRGGVRARHVLGTALVVGAFGYGVLRLAGGAAALPSPGWAGVLLIVLMAVGVYVAGLPVRRLRAGRPSPTVGPLRAARTLVLAQAAALSGAGLFGWYAAQALVLVPDLDVDSQRARLWPLLVLVVAGGLLVVSGLLVQRMCRLDTEHRPGSGEDDEAR